MSLFNEFKKAKTGTQRVRRMIKTLWRGERQEIHAYNILRKRKNHAKLFKKEAMID